MSTILLAWVGGYATIHVTMDARELLTKLQPMHPGEEHQHFKENMDLLEEYAQSLGAHVLLADVHLARRAAKTENSFEERAPEIWTGLINSVARIAKQNDPEMDPIDALVYFQTRYMRPKP